MKRHWCSALSIDHALVTGGGSGLGRSICLGLAACGVSVTALGRRVDMLDQTAELAADLPGTVRCVPTDIRDVDAVAAAFSTAEVAAGPVDALVHAAAEATYTEALDLTTEAFDDAVAISLNGGFYVLQRWAQGLVRERRPGSAVVLTSGGAWRGVPGVAHSSAAKAGMESFVRAVAREWGPHGLRVNIVGPGVFPVEKSYALWSDSDLSAHMMKDIPLGRYGDRDEIVGPTIFLLSDAASYVTGQTLLVDGGTSMFPWPVRPQDIARGLKNDYDAARETTTS